ncbi:hypothetical protein BDZ45DRAFT_739145 [Acephala macrosclerotiorum]|nr:hypothetical protein BDZ45DRAFT_739145 [Acephala macrosclerotiorum]
MSATPELHFDEMTVERSLHSKFVSSPQRLSTELKDLLGPGQYKVEMRHNVYNIRSSKDFDLNELMTRCKYLPRNGSTAANSAGIFDP